MLTKVTFFYHDMVDYDELLLECDFWARLAQVPGAFVGL